MATLCPGGSHGAGDCLPEGLGCVRVESRRLSGSFHRALKIPDLGGLAARKLLITGRLGW